MNASGKSAGLPPADPSAAGASPSRPRSAAPATTDRRLVRLFSGDYWGIEGRPVEVQIDVSPHSNPGFTIVGLPGKSICESRERIRAAIQNSGYLFPQDERILVNLAPAFQKKDGMVFDLAVALGILLATGQVSDPCRDRPGSFLPFGLLGELGLEGELRPVPGTLLIAAALRDRGIHRLVVPAQNAAEAVLAPGVQACAAENLHEAIEALCGRKPPIEAGGGAASGEPPEPERGKPAGDAGLDFADVRGQESTKRGLLIAAAGGHNLFLVGPPGVGKTMLARRIPGILPPLEFEESLEVMRISSAAGLLRPSRRLCERPFRAPHHTISYAGLVGGGNPPRPGEISLAHCGVLFLDELPEFPRKVLETLRQPMEAGTVTISRSSGTVVFPARFLVVAAMNPCPCGYAGYAQPACRCSHAAIENYRQRISGPLLDRMDLFLEVAQPSAREVLARSGSRPAAGMSTEDMRGEVFRARGLQASRWGRSLTNSRVHPELLLGQGNFLPAALARLEGEATRRRLSARGMGRILRIARTLADLEASESVGEEQVWEALALRRQETLGKKDR